MKTFKHSKMAIIIASIFVTGIANAEGWEPAGGWAPILVTPDMTTKKHTDVKSMQQLDIESIHQRYERPNQSQSNTQRPPSSSPNGSPAATAIAPTAPGTPVFFANESQAREYFANNVSNPGAIAVSMFNNNLNYRDVARITGYSEEQVRGFLRPSNADLAKYIEENKHNPENIRKVANLYGLTQGDLVGATGYPVQTVSQYFGDKALDRDIKNLIEQQVANPAQMVRMLDQYKISPEDASRATGIPLEQVKQYIAKGKTQNIQATNNLGDVLRGTSISPTGGNPTASQSQSTGQSGFGPYGTTTQTGQTGQNASSPTRQTILGEEFTDYRPDPITPERQAAIDNIQFLATSFNDSVTPFASINLSTAINRNVTTGNVGKTQRDVTIREFVSRNTNNSNAVKQYVTSNQVSIDEIARATGLTNAQIKGFLKMN